MIHPPLDEVGLGARQRRAKRPQQCGGLERPLTDRELRDELLTLLLAGHETTATSIGWAFERLLRTPRALERLTAEASGGQDHDYIDAVIKETLRVRPVVSEVVRAPTNLTVMAIAEHAAEIIEES